ncbi:MAG TPA: carbon monoxide dehydrogenase subunit G [Acetobacteraceae bacterium]|jgi:hypothetical protein
MDMTGERRISAPRQVVWDALNDPAVLKASIPGCESLDKTSDTTMKATVSLKIGPISARFTGAVTLSDIDAPNGYTISGEGQGGVAGFAKGGAKVHLADDGAGGTILTYEVHAQVGGKIAQLGARLIDASAKQISDQFFDRFGAAVAPPVPTPAAPTAPMPVAAPAEHQPPSRPTPARPIPPPPMPSAVPISALVPREPFGLPTAAWIGGLVFLFLVLLYIGSIF